MKKQFEQKETNKTHKQNKGCCKYTQTQFGKPTYTNTFYK